ncbi:hypothetical protein [Leptospira santarosai]|uniref:Uncharacterized protein n=1 Tax=Leptospira santarosai serovar Shermani str. LT 821 TaxID=758847 RepID=K8Y4D4_9LEPT|nr:hypothetical protein [Leptospira santarosai]EKT87846.1 hypothetical protein LSS_05768 [Leptospira santarosai serovar Shermani str. LT 821]MDI7175350.1 hypothetical protein [Leptospira santarosai]MDI7188727.1 hypothetical protein [Leptospira santarosai]MDI7194795.1 hypothetical protein [Leptospira santarosai]MDI7230351.1 hypothetical protein [Leptospira santarosai]
MNENSSSGWKFEIMEVSNGVYKVRALNKDGLKIELEGFDPEKLMLDIKKSALEIEMKARQNRKDSSH